MGQQKGNPTPSYQNQAYETLRPNTNARENRNYGTKPVMIDDNTTINDYIDLTFDTDAVAAMVSGSTNSTIFAVSGSTNSTIFAVSGSTNSTINALSASVSATYITSASMRNTISSFIVFGGAGGGYANDTAAGAAGVPVGGLYHTAGAVKVRLT
jgi:hypothetical protein